MGARRTAFAAAMPAAAVAAAATLGGAGGGKGVVGASASILVDDAPSTSSSSTTTTRQPLRARILAAAGASFVSVIVVNPFDVVKVRTRAGVATMFFDGYRQFFSIRRGAPSDNLFREKK